MIQKNHPKDNVVCLRVFLIVKNMFFLTLAEKLISESLYPSQGHQDRGHQRL